MSIDPLKVEVQQKIDDTTQVERGKEIDEMLKKIGKVKFQDLSKAYKSDQLDETRFKKIKKWLMVGSVVLAVSAVIAAIASIIFSAGTGAVAGTLAIAVASGMVAITPSFKGLDGTIRRYIEHIREEKNEKNRINKVKKKITDVSTLILARVETFPNVPQDKQADRGKEILGQINKVNEYIKKIKKEVPKKVIDFDFLDPSPLLKAIG